VQHGLALGPSGQCVLCRRTSLGVPVAAERKRHSPVWSIASLVGLIATGAAAWASFRSHAHNSPPPPALTRITPADLEAKKQPAASAKPPEDDLTKSLRMLEEAERDRLAKLKEEDERAQTQRAAASLQRAREEKARDAQRHEAIKRELDAMALATARRNVNITMYSTSWCGVCKRARAYMQQHQISFTELDVEHDAAASARQHALNPGGGVPTIAIDDQVLIGFSPESLESRIDTAAKHRTGS
jgi:glutaredoxin